MTQRNTKRRPRKKRRAQKAGTFSLLVLIASFLAAIVLVIITIGSVRKDVISAKENQTSGSDAQQKSLTKETKQSETETDEAVTVGTSDAPVIYGVIPLNVYQGHTVSYKSGVYVTDDNDDSPTLEIDNSGVDLTTPGVYIVKYIATDKDGNVAHKTTTLTVLEGEDLVDEAEIWELADKVIDRIIDEDMDAREKCLAVYKYLHQFGYVDTVYSEDWMQNAYRVLQTTEGDCFGMYSCARLILTRLGFDVMEVQNNTAFTHYWSLVSIDGGENWYHFDPTCWVWGEDGIICLVCDETMIAFSERHPVTNNGLAYSWDSTKYPASPAEDLMTEEEMEIIYRDGQIENKTHPHEGEFDWDHLTNGED